MTKKQNLFLLVSSLFFLGACSEGESTSLINSSSSLETTITSSESEVSSVQTQESSTTQVVSSSSSSNESTGTSFTMFFKENKDISTGGINKTEEVERFNTDVKALYPSVTSITSTGYVQMMSIDDGQLGTYRVLVLGSKNSSGNLTFKFSSNLASVKFNVSAYSKYVSFNTTMNVDINPTLEIEGSSYTVPSEANTRPTAQDFTYNYSTTSKQLTFGSTGAASRVMVNSITVTFKA